ncbi:MAG: hypothetical protein ACR2M5_09315 [Nakamurella sp.]
MSLTTTSLTTTVRAVPITVAIPLSKSAVWLVTALVFAPLAEHLLRPGGKRPSNRENATV